MSNVETIAAIATAPGEAGISIVRISGPDAFPIVDRVFRCKGKPVSERPAGTFVHGRVEDASGQVVDEVIALVYRAPKSFTREDTIELQGHGGRICAGNVLRALLDAGAHSAAPGEFTKRAFLNGRLDLIQAESVLSLIQAQTDRAARVAMDQLIGRLSLTVDHIYSQGLNVAADLEACLDFEQGELPESAMANIQERMEQVCLELKALIDTWSEGRLLREGVKVVIAGQPNAGKSTLMNVLLGTNRAIVTDLPGTTRDVIEEGLVIDGIPIRLVDTAGIRETECIVEREGIRRAELVMREADLVLYVLDTSKAPSPVDMEYLKELSPAKTIVILNKTDLGNAVESAHTHHHTCVCCSLTKGLGLPDIQKVIGNKLKHDARLSGTSHIVIQERHRIALGEAHGFMESAKGHVAARRDANLMPAVSDIREALQALGSITGRVYTDDILDLVFSKFCIGK